MYNIEAAEFEIDRLRDNCEKYREDIGALESSLKSLRQHNEDNREDGYIETLDGTNTDVLAYQRCALTFWVRI